MYNYPFTLIRVIDGDTIQGAVDLGFNMQYTTTFRLFGINAPEMSTGIPGAEAKTFLSFLLESGGPLTVDTLKDKTGKYGRYLGIFKNAEGKNINDLMLKGGHAIVYK